jgi:hypothetical protein
MIAVVGFFVRYWRFPEFGTALNLTVFLWSIPFLSFVWEFFYFINRKLNRVLPFERSIPGRIVVQIGIGVAFMVLLRILLYYFGEPYLPFTLDALFRLSTFLIFILIGAIINFGFFIVFLIEKWKESIIQAEKLEKEKALVQFDNLKNQLNPHFLFNALTSLNSLISENQALASQFLQHMSKVYRYVLQNKDRNFVSLQTELDFIKNYVFLAETRFGHALKIKFEISDTALERTVVPVTLQILIENALKHNVIDSEKPLVVEVYSSGDYLVVSNNLQSRKLVETSNKQGLENLRSLYRFMTDRAVVLETSETRFTVKVPLL